MLTGGVAIPEYPGDHFNYVFSKILMAGRANGLQVIDGPFLKIRELDSLREFSQRTRVLGYDGKWALTPDQVGRPERGLLADPGAVRQGVGHPRRLPKATEDDRTGAVMFGDEMIDEASRKMAIKFVTRGERAGLEPLRRLTAPARPAGRRPGTALGSPRGRCPRTRRPGRRSTARAAW